jgi:hypothetical protein
MPFWHRVHSQRAMQIASLRNSNAHKCVILRNMYIGKLVACAFASCIRPLGCTSILGRTAPRMARFVPLRKRMTKCNENHQQPESSRFVICPRATECWE